MNKLKQVFCDQSIHHFVLTTSMLCQLCKVWQKLLLPIFINQTSVMIHVDQRHHQAF